MKQLLASGVLGMMAIGLYAEARYQIKDNTKKITELEVHQGYNTQYFIDIKKELGDIKTLINGNKAR